MVGGGWGLMRREEFTCRNALGRRELGRMEGRGIPSSSAFHDEKVEGGKEGAERVASRIRGPILYGFKIWPWGDERLKSDRRLPGPGLNLIEHGLGKTRREERGWKTNYSDITTRQLAIS